MDVEQIQKINNLALDLIKQGLASDRDEAISQAEKIFRGSKEAEQYNSMRETIKEVEAEKKLESNEETTENNQEFSSSENDGLSQDQIKDILKQNTHYLVKTIKGFNEEIANLKKEIALLRTKINYQKLPTVKDIVSQRSEHIEEPDNSNISENIMENKDIDNQNSTNNEEKQKSNPRIGNFVEDDVSIEKFFYMGSK